MIEITVTYLSLILLPLIAIYVHRLLFFYHGLRKLTLGNNTEQPPVSIIVPARNEEQNIEHCLNSLLVQNYPTEKLSIVVVDDQSTDGTVEIVRRIASSSPIPMLLCSSLQHSDIRSPKIRTLAQGIQHSAGTIIITTDADCTAAANWVKTLVSYFDEGVGVVTGLTVIQKTKDISSLFWGVQFLDFISYTSIAAGAIGWNRMLIGNGSNMAFRREAFDAAGGYETIKHINTGDDSLLAQRIVMHGKWNPRFAFSPEAAIVTNPAVSFREVLHQRMRWVGQTAYYPASMMFFLISTFFMFVCLTITLPLTFSSWNSVPWAVLLLKFLTDFFMMRRFTKLTATEEAMKYFIPAAMVHIPMVLLATIGGYFFTFEWKNREMKRESTK
jgi:biofilm PGA synthesis N-glycosyltransferase PgaC